MDGYCHSLVTSNPGLVLTEKRTPFEVRDNAILADARAGFDATAGNRTLC
jgi:hypothetical protein